MVLVRIKAAMPKKAMATRDSQNKSVANTEAENMTKDTFWAKEKRANAPKKPIKAQQEIRPQNFKATPSLNVKSFVPIVLPHILSINVRFYKEKNTQLLMYRSWVKYA